MITESIAFTGSFIFTQNQAWNGMTELRGLCLCTSEVKKPTNVYDVTFQCNAAIPLAAVKLHMLSSTRWRAYNMDEQNELGSFLSSVFHKTIDSIGPTVNSLVIQIDQDVKTIKKEAAMMKEYPLKPKSKLLLYGERQNVGEKIIIYAQPIYAIDEFASLYHLEDLADFSETMSQTGESISVSQILGQTLPVLTKTKEEVDEMDLIREIEMSQKEKSDTVSKQPTSIRKRIHSKPIKTIFKPHTKKPIPKLSTVKALTESPSPSLSVEDKKKMIKSLIKDFLAKNNHKKSEETSQLAQQIYLSMRYALRNILEKSATLNEAQLNHIIKSHYDFYANNDSLVDLLFPSE